MTMRILMAFAAMATLGLGAGCSSTHTTTTSGKSMGELRAECNSGNAASCRVVRQHDELL